MKTYKRILIFFLVTVIMALVAGFIWFEYQNSKKAVVKTNKIEYIEGENPKVIIKNKLQDDICFSSCYPYYLERKNGKGYESYKYGNCLNNDVAEKCIDPGQLKAFELLLEGIKFEKGFHRISIPACIGCALEEGFRKDKWFYSNEFLIK